jgi:trehalose 6-phosphate synthase/phosphatase
MPADEQQRRNRIMRERLNANDLHHWVHQFFRKLEEVRETSHVLAVKLLDAGHKQNLVTDYNHAKSRLLMLDYDGTLVPFAGEPDKALPDEQILSLLQKLTAPINNHVVILSGRDRHTLDRWLGHLDITLVAEHGGWVRHRRKTVWTQTTTPAADGWKKDIRPILELFVGRIPGSMIEDKDFSLVWHFRNSESETSSAAARELLDTLSTLSANLHFHVLPGDKTIEIRTMGISKGVFYTQFLAGLSVQFTLAMGDDWTDEDLFAVVPPSAYSIKVAPRISKARFNLKSVHDVRLLLEKLAAQPPPIHIGTGAPSIHELPTDAAAPEAALQSQGGKNE